MIVKIDHRLLVLEPCDVFAASIGRDIVDVRRRRDPKIAKRKVLVGFPPNEAHALTKSAVLVQTSLERTSERNNMTSEGPALRLIERGLKLEASELDADF